MPGGRSGRRDKPHGARKLCEALHCENDQTKTSSFSHDWHVQPDCQRSITGVRLSGPFWIKEYTAELCVLELVALHLRDCLQPPQISPIFRNYRSFRRLSMEIFR